MEFSEESLFFFRNWVKIEKFLPAEKRFRKEFTEYLYTLEARLKERKWWNSQLAFIKLGSSQVYFSRDDWKYSEKEYAIWIGIEKFSPESVLGTLTPANYYLWITGDGKEKTISELSDIINRTEGLKEHQVSSGQYVIQRYLRNYTEEEYEEIISGVLLIEAADFLEKIYFAIQDYTYQQ